MTSPATIYHTAAHLARALGRQRQALARALAAVPADGRMMVNGALVNAWSFAALPADLKAEIGRDAQRLGFRDAQSLLEATGWPQSATPAVPLADVAQGALAKAVKLQRALARTLAAQNDSSLSAPALEEMGLADYAREFGHAITGRHLRRLVNRTMDRARAACVQTFDRLDLFLPENPARKLAPKAAPVLAREAEFHALHEAMAAFKNPAAPSAAEKSFLWLAAFEAYEEKLAEGRAPKKLKRSLLQFLERNAPFLVAADSLAVGNSLRVNFQRKYARWLKEDHHAKSLADRRNEKSGRWRAPELSQADRDKLIAHAVFNCGGRAAQAWRELVDRKELSADILGYYLGNPARKSYVPKQVLESIKHEIASMDDLHHGPRQARLNGPHISRDWSSVHSQDFMQADDFTFPIYYRAPDDNGGWAYMRGQTLLMIDVRSTRILGFVLISERNYTARAIRALITKVCDEHGLPRRGFYFENGIWRKAKILTGAAGAPPLSWGETEMGLREFGLKFVHSQLPRSKPVERVGGLLQDLMEGLPGYVGRNEMTEKFERVQKLKRDAERGDPDAAARFMDEDQWSGQLFTLCQRYNAAARDGKMTDGLSPDETFNRCHNPADPPVKFSAHCRYLLAHHKRPVKVTGKGILIEKAYYYGKEIEAMKGQTLLAWIDPETPDFITVTDMNRRNAVCVPRAKDVPAMEAPAEALAAAYGQIADFQGYTKSRYRILKASRVVTFRPMMADRETVELGAQIGQQRAALETAQREGQKQETKGRQAASRLGIAMTREKLRRPETAAALEALNELLESETDPTEGKQP